MSLSSTPEHDWFYSVEEIDMPALTSYDKWKLQNPEDAAKHERIVRGLEEEGELPPERKFADGDRVYLLPPEDGRKTVDDMCRTGTIVSAELNHGDYTTKWWYVVKFDDGYTDSYVEGDLE